ncbi:MAG: tetratricopeptide repeat protein [Chitinophagaceae bacterium]|nr:tetratricopeptide repeat protein [Chitinophagaceae bacterium]
MRYILHIFFLFILSVKGFSQENTTAPVKKMMDSILKVYELEKNDVVRYEMLLRFITLSGLEADPLEFIEFARKVYKISQKNKDKGAEATALTMFGQGYRLMGNYTKALECHYKGIAIALKVGNKLQISHSYNQLGHIYKDREENDKAIEIYRMAYLYSEYFPDKISKYAPPMNLGIVYLNKGNLDSSIYYSNRALEVLKLTNETQNIFIPSILSNLGGAYSRLNKKKKAEEYFQRALSIVTNPEYKSPRQLLGLYFNIAEHFRMNQQLDSCLYYAKLSISSVENSVYSYLMAKPATLISELYEGKNADSTVKYLKIYLKTNEVINSTRVTQQLQVMAFEEEQRKMELEQTRKEAQARLKIYFLIAGLLLVSVFGVLMFRNNKQKQKINAKLENTLANLQATQKQLVQSEKMASLGELTAGIAHEIQNPLNFVNNFSEVSTELVKEMVQEVDKGNTDEVKAIANDVVQNLEKINHHGQRASDIVKGMLQHSRSSSGVKEPTDINALADEYFRLAYHGLRAKDKTFNATMKTDFDESIGKINIIPQDIGRVVLNLITNAFYAVNEKSKQGIADYEPTVSVVTKKVNHQVEIRVTDNGNGIPANIVDKIFQPFFTTKPTGQGTGLGLSLSYDIVKAHVGEITVESKEGMGTEFIIQLPIV